MCKEAKHNLSSDTKGSRKKMKVIFLVARPLRGGGGKGLATKKKEPFLKAKKGIIFFCRFPNVSNKSFSSVSKMCVGHKN